MNQSTLQPKIYFNYCFGLCELKKSHQIMKALTTTAPDQEGHVKIKDILGHFDEQINSAIEKLSADYSGVIAIGFNTAVFASKISLIKTGVETINQFHDIYLKFLKGKEAGLESIKEVISLKFTKTEALAYELKLRYIKWNNISIPNFQYIKPEKMVELVELPDEDAVLLNQCTLLKDKLRLVDGNELLSYYNAGKLEFTKEHEEDLYKTCVVFADEHQVSEILHTHLTCVSLNALKKPGYSFKELPEIDHRLLSRIRIDDHGDYIAVDLKKFAGKDIEINFPNADDNYHFEILKSEDPSLPEVFFNGKHYKFTCPSISDPERHETFPGSGVSRSIRFADLVASEHLEDRKLLIRVMIKLIKIRSGAIAEVVYE